MSSDKDAYKLWTDAIKSATSLGVRVTSTPEERKRWEELEERQRQEKRMAAEQAAERRYEPDLRDKWSRALEGWSSQRCSPVWPRTWRLEAQTELYNAVHATVDPSQRNLKLDQLDKLIDEQVQTCGTDRQFSTIHGVFLRDIQFKERRTKGIAPCPFT
jgi:hypothetical protein